MATQYDTDKQGPGPFEGRKPDEQDGHERRSHPRSSARYRLHIAAHRGAGEKPLVARGEVVNASVSGMYLRTRQSLEVGQLIDLAIPTKGCPDDFALPKAFLGKARVTRVERIDEEVSGAGLSVDRDLLDDMSYAVFVEYQCRRTGDRQ